MADKKFKIAGTIEEVDNSSNEETETSTTFDTNLKISNHSRNMLQAMANIGYADSQKSAIDIALLEWANNLSEIERQKFDLQVKTLEQRDIKRKNKK